MRILITNDDGISAPGLEAAEAIAHELAGPDGEVWVVAPAFEQSGVGHCVSYIRPMRLEPLGPRRHAVEGSPADCVMAGLYEVMADCQPDLVLSGVNRGHNVAEDTLYSGTIGGAMEAALQGRRAIAMSQYFGPENRHLEDPFAAARAHGARVIRQILAADIWEETRYGVFYNINFPPCPAGDVRGVKATRQGHRASATFGVERQVAPNGRTYLWLTHGHDNASSAPGTDAREALEGHITVTPLRADLTAHDLVDRLSPALS
ncbi:5'/3'-nucleotidase SurE [Paroceanicella profunda]|uniref:5'-nucleotidase SurE n=1 Tax=Paroceanicella profunda TaxID=2579971 RepID=A0A5B8FHW7_9RHOB|nr:5'/3'-nucleotidase SurE [Paroceanicella profunda]QDL92680.1 5'/3'-nucleotidase SurE [Paroceanicella profunda]QDL92687.1 5'/3'-nucleotidase SurE [Paroceanicella profunda]